MITCLPLNLTSLNPRGPQKHSLIPAPHCINIGQLVAIVVGKPTFINNIPNFDFRYRKSGNTKTREIWWFSEILAKFFLQSTIV